MTEPIFWLGLSILLVAVSLTAVLVVALPALQELARAARSAQTLFDTLTRELPPTLEAIRLTGLEISDLTDDISEGVKSAGQVVKQVDQGIGEAKKRAQRVQGGTRRAFVGVKAAWKSLTRPVTQSSKHLSSAEGEALAASDDPNQQQLIEIETELKTEAELELEPETVDTVSGENRIPLADSVTKDAGQPSDVASLRQTLPETPDSEPTATQETIDRDMLDTLIDDFSEKTPGSTSDDTTAQS